MSADKTEQPTPHKLSEERKKGNVSKGKDIVGAFQFIIGFTILYFSLPLIGRNFMVLLRKYLDFQIFMPMQPRVLNYFLQDAVFFILVNILPLLTAMLLVGIFGNYFQIGTIFAIDPIKPQMKRLNPVEGFKNMFKITSLFELCKNLIKIFLSFYLFYITLKGELSAIIYSITLEPMVSMNYFSRTIYLIVLKISLIYIGISVVDLIFQKKQYIKQLKMSKKEVKDEYKQLEGDPQVKGQRQQLYQEIGQHNMVQDVKKSTVIVVNPDEIAVALTYDKSKMNAPRITAKGRNEIAKSIKELAKEYDIPIVQNINLAHSLVGMEIGQDIPPNLYEAVAEVLKYVYELSNKEDAD